MFKPYAHFGVAERQGGLGIKTFPQRKNFGSYQPKKHRKIYESDCEDHINRPCAANRHQHHGKNEDRERLDDIEETQHPLRYPPHPASIGSLKVAGNDAQRRTNSNRERGGNDSDKDVNAGSGNEARQNIDAVLIRPEGMKPIWRHQSVLRIGESRRVRRNKRTKGRYDQYNDKGSYN